MAAKYVGTVKSPGGKPYDVRWDPNSRDVYVSYAGGTKCGKAKSDEDAIYKAKSFLREKNA